jgi:3-phosphoshikimate 1-carboxyvinyltransferase
MAPSSPSPSSAPTIAVEPLDGPLDAVVRALVCAALADGPSLLHGALVADDTLAMVSCLRSLGFGVHEVARGHDDHAPDVRLRVDGVAGPLPVPAGASLDARLSGTTARFLLPVLARAEGPTRLDGAEPLRRRPMADGVAAVRSLGAEVIEEGEPGHLPVVVHGAPPAEGTGPRRVAVAGDASSQFLSGLLMTGPRWPRGLQLDVAGSLVSRPYVDMTAAVMRAFGARVDQAGDTWSVPAGGYRATAYDVEPDASAASYAFAAAAVVGGRVTVPGLGRASLQGDLAFVDVLERMGCRVERGAAATTVERRGPLSGVDVDMGDMSDTAQTLAAVAVFAGSPTRVRGIGFIRAKETDRVGNVVTELRRCGIDASEEPDGYLIRPGTPRPAVVQTYDDHRMAMSFALLGLRAPGIEIADPGVVAKTFPTYWEVLGSLAESPPGDPTNV